MVTWASLSGFQEGTGQGRASGQEQSKGSRWKPVSLADLATSHLCCIPLVILEQERRHDFMEAHQLQGKRGMREKAQITGKLGRNRGENVDLEVALLTLKI